MRKIVVIIVLLVFNFYIAYAKIKDNNLDRVDIALDNDELAIIVITLDTSTSLLLKRNDEYLLFLIDYTNDKKLKKNIKVFTDKLSEVYMNQNYNYDGKVITNKVSFNDVILTKDTILYKGKKICINHSEDCHYSIITQKDILVDEKVEAVFYRNNLSDSYINYLSTLWIDKYRLTTDNYTVITLADHYQVDQLVK